MLDEDVKITRVQEDRRFDDQGKVIPVMRIEFKVGMHGPFVEKWDKADYSASVRDDRLNTFAREVRSS